MLYIFDSRYSDDSNQITFEHGDDTVALIKYFNKTVELQLISTEQFNSLDELFNKMRDICNRLTSTDIVLIPWIMCANLELDTIAGQMSAACVIICAAGNLSQPASQYSPARAPGVVTVGCLNKSSKPAQLSNLPTTEKSLEWMYGTNIHLPSGRTVTGTSASAAIYAALYARAIKFKNPSKFMDRSRAILKKKFEAELAK